MNHPNNTGYLTSKYHGGLQPNDCTLNGKPAVISYGEHFALVRQLGIGLGCEWSNQSAKRIMERDRKFKT